MIMTTDDTKIAGLRSKERYRDHDLQPSLKPMTKQVWRKSLNRTSVNIVFDVFCLCHCVCLCLSMTNTKKSKPITKLAVQKYLNQCMSTFSLSSSMQQCNAGEHLQCRRTFATQGNICNAGEHLQCRWAFATFYEVFDLRQQKCSFSLIEAQSVCE